MKKTHIFSTLTRTLILCASFAIVLAVTGGSILGDTIPSLSGPTLMLHLKSDTGIQLNGSTVSQWDDQSGLGNHFVQGAGGSQPLLVNNELNGQPVLRFDGNSDWMSVIGTGLAGAQLPLSFFAVTTNTTNPLGLFDSAPNAANTFRFFNNNQVEIWNQDPVLPLNLQATGSVISVRGSLGPNRLLELRELSPSGVNSTSAPGGAAQVSFVGGLGRTPNIGTINQGGNGFFNGDLAELIIYSGTLDDGQREEIEEYLQAQYGLSPLPPLPPPTPVIPSALGNYGQSVLGAGPVAYWRLETNEGLVAADTASAAGPPQQGPQDGAYQDMSLHNRGQAGPRPTDLVGGQPLLGFAADNHAADFQGNAAGGNDVVVIADDGNLDFVAGGAFSISAWVKASPGQESGAAIIAKGTGGGGETFAIDMVNDMFRLFTWNATGTIATVVQTTITVDDTWQHIVATVDLNQGLMKLYVNGQEEGSSTPGLSLRDNNNHDVSIGSRKSSAADAYNFNFDGLIDEVALYNRALSGAEVQASFDAAFVPEPSALVLAIFGFIGLAGIMRKRFRSIDK